MSTMNTLGEKIVLGRTPEELLDVGREWAGRDAQRWKGLACLALALRGFSAREIGLAFGHPKGHVGRIVDQTQLALAERFGPDDPPPAERLRHLADAA